MENNKLIITENGIDVEYRVLLNIEDVEGKNYVIYTKDEENEKGEILTFVAEYIENKENGNIKLISIKDDKEWEFIRDILNSITDKEEE